MCESERKESLDRGRESSRIAAKGLVTNRKLQSENAMLERQCECQCDIALRLI
jgi:hypothetical protein